VEFDVRKGWRTTPVRFGVRGSRREHLALTIVALAAPLLFAWRGGAWLLLPLLTLPVAVAVERRVWKAERREELIPWTPRSAFLSLGYAALLAAGLALSRAP
ncbi:MAG TPA: UbiA family prenyltransferase, partial [bacterium]|nr:UbiA family prenyltransferase [bacterium]